MVEVDTPVGRAGAGALAGGRGKWWPLAAVSVAIFMLLIDITVVNVALPNIQTDLHASFAELQWVVNAYALTLAALQLTAGTLGDRLGRRWLFIAGICLFALASLGCGLAPSAAALDFLRAVQGIGGAVMYSNSLALISDNYTGRDRATAFGVWGAVSGASVAVGPLIGGALTTSLSWRWIFFVNLPLAAIAVTISVARLQAARPEHSRRIDWTGLVSFSAALALLVFALIEGNSSGWTSAEIIGLLAGSAVLFGVFVAAEMRVRQPMVDMGLFRRPGFVGAQVGAFAISASLYSLFLFLTLYLQDVLDFNALGAGLRLLPLTVLALVSAPIAGKLTDRVPFRLLVSLSLGVTGAGVVLMYGVTPASSWTALLAGFVIAGIGSGAVNPPLGSLAVGVVPRHEAGMGSGVNITFRQVGIATGIAAMGAVFQSHITSYLSHHLPQLGGQANQLGAAVASGGFGQAIARFPAGVRPQVRHVAAAGFVSGLNELFWIAAAIAFIGAVASLALIRQRDVISGQAHQEAPAAG
ncbi:MAG: MFS transporter [Acidimicrobiales bacterium]